MVCVFVALIFQDNSNIPLEHSMDPGHDLFMNGILSNIGGRGGFGGDDGWKTIISFWGPGPVAFSGANSLFNFRLCMFDF